MYNEYYMFFLPLVNTAFVITTYLFPSLMNPAEYALLSKSLSLYLPLGQLAFLGVVGAFLLIGINLDNIPFFIYGFAAPVLFPVFEGLLGYLLYDEMASNPLYAILPIAAILDLIMGLFIYVRYLIPQTEGFMSWLFTAIPWWAYIPLLAIKVLTWAGMNEIVTFIMVPIFQLSDNSTALAKMVMTVVSYLLWIEPSVNILQEFHL